MSFSEEEKRELQVEARVLLQAYPVLRPLLERRKQATYERLLSSYRSGEVDTNAIAELSVIEAIQHEIKTKLEYADAIGD